MTAHARFGAAADVMLSLSDPSAETQAIWQLDHICRTNTDLSKRLGFTAPSVFGLQRRRP
jgi:hypothetical protein